MHAAVVLVSELVPAEGEAAREAGHQAVGTERLRRAVEQQRRGDRYEPVELREEQLALSQRNRQCGHPVSARHAQGGPHHHGVEEVHERPLHDVARGGAPGHEDPEEDEGSGEAVVEPGLGGDGELRLLGLAGLVARGAHADVAGQHGIGGGEHTAEDQGGAQRQPHHQRPEDHHQPHGCGQYQRDQQHHRPPRGEAQAALHLQPGGEDGYQQGHLRHAAHQLRILDRVQRLDAEHIQPHARDQAQPQVDHRGRVGPFALVGECGDGHQERQADAEQADEIGVAGGQAELGSEGSHAPSLPPSPPGPRQPRSGAGRRSRGRRDRRRLRGRRCGEGAAAAGRGARRSR